MLVVLDPADQGSGTVRCFSSNKIRLCRSLVHLLLNTQVYIRAGNSKYKTSSACRSIQSIWNLDTDALIVASLPASAVRFGVLSMFCIRLHRKISQTVRMLKVTRRRGRELCQHRPAQTMSANRRRDVWHKRQEIICIYSAFFIQLELEEVTTALPSPILVFIYSRSNKP